MVALRSTGAGTAWTSARKSLERVALRPCQSRRVLRQCCSEAPAASVAQCGCQADPWRQRQVAARIAGRALCAVASIAGCSIAPPARAMCQALPPPQQTPPQMPGRHPSAPAATPGRTASITCRGIARFIDMIMQVCIGALLGRLCNGRYPSIITAVAMAVPTLQMAFIWPGQSFGKRYMELQVREHVNTPLHWSG